ACIRQSGAPGTTGATISTASIPKWRANRLDVSPPAITSRSTRLACITWSAIWARVLPYKLAVLPLISCAVNLRFRRTCCVFFIRESSGPILVWIITLCPSCICRNTSSVIAEISYVSGLVANSTPSIATPLNPFVIAYAICLPVTTEPLPERTNKGLAGLSDGHSVRGDKTPAFFHAAHSAFDTADDPTEKRG